MESETLITNFSHYTELLYTSRLLLADLGFKNMEVESKKFTYFCMPLFMPTVSFTAQKVKPHFATFL